MTNPMNAWLCLAGMLAMSCAPAYATVAVTSMTASPQSPQVIGTAVTWTVKATDSNAGPLTFQFSVVPPGGSAYAIVRDFNVGIENAGVWRPVTPFVWNPTKIEGTYKINAVVKDFTSGETA